MTFQADTIERIFALADSVRYVATYTDGQLQLAQRPGINEHSEAETDRYEELLVNPTVLKLLTQRGDIDCGGLEYVLIRYGAFFQFVIAVPGGHVSVALEPTTEVLALAERIQRELVE